MIVALATLGMTVVSGASAEMGYATKADYRNGVMTDLGSAAAAVPKAGGDTCATPTAIGPTPYTDSGTTLGAVNDVAAVPIACNGNYTAVAGPDHIYSVTVGAGNNLSFTATPTAAWDPSIYLLSTCGTGTSCVTGADDGLSNTAESFSASGLAAGTYFFYVDSFYSTGALSAGPYTVDITGTVPVELQGFSVD